MSAFYIFYFSLVVPLQSFSLAGEACWHIFTGLFLFWHKLLLGFCFSTAAFGAGRGVHGIGSQRTDEHDSNVIVANRRLVSFLIIRWHSFSIE